MSMNRFFDLPVIKQISHSITLRQYDELELLVVDHPNTQAVIALQGAHLIHWQPTGHQPVIWLSEKALFKKSTAIRGGVPICWPWFGAKKGASSHGFARHTIWELAAHSENSKGVILTLSLRQNAKTLELWPHEFSLFVRFTLEQLCHIELESFGEYQTTSALHSYFNIGEITQTTLSGLGERYIDKVSNSTVNEIEHTNVRLTQHTDRIYTAAHPVNLIQDPLLQRTITVKHDNHSDVVVWNPFPQASQFLKDMTPSGYQTMLCLETANISKPLISSEKHSARFAVTFSVALYDTE